MDVTQCVLILLKLFYQLKNDYNSTLLLFLSIMKTTVIFEDPNPPIRGGCTPL